ncbi:hypothetical protein OG21DRAFT_1483948 [Imleria badia]|nr:hypothetical protein OG21DRAFT_1483948 [Imleria badia]
MCYLASSGTFGLDATPGIAFFVNGLFVFQIAAIDVVPRTPTPRSPFANKQETIESTEPTPRSCLLLPSNTNERQRPFGRSDLDKALRTRR